MTTACFQRGRTYPLRRPDRYDDELGGRYGYAALADRGPIDVGCCVHDAWTVDAHGRVHPACRDRQSRSG